MGRSIKVCAAHFWPGFSLQVGFVRYLLNQALGPFVVVASETEADIVVSKTADAVKSVFANL